jgi:EAL domain-containing protein (putative c-di-GMP-specific phosphodiesterase class I)/ribosomal protein L12E/L44/L45/RPP1/RPP2
VLNDVHGAATGDLVLRGVADAMGDRLRSTDALGRVGSDEFAVILPGTGADAARAVAEALLAAIRGLSIDEVHVTASIGVAAAESEPAGAELLAEADAALAAAKQGGRDRVVFAEPGNGARARARQSLSWVARVRRALETGGLELHAQPIVGLDGPARERHELLVRLRGDDGVPVAPGEFLPSAERFGQIQAIDGWVLGRALDLLRRTGPDGPVLHINLAPASVGDADLMAFTERAVVASDVSPERLVFEITETAAIGDISAARATVDRLRGLGCAIAIDDFGMGFGSFSHLKQIPFDILKIAGEFVHEVMTSRVDRLTVEAMAQVARGMGMATVAEYVGNDGTVGLLRDMRIDFAQGFHTGAPRPVADLWGQ